MFVNPVMELLNPVVDGIMEKERKRLNGVLSKLLIKNAETGGNKSAYIHMGDFYSLIPRKYLRNEKVDAIHSSLVSEAEELRQLLAKLDHDTKRIRQALAVVIPKCRDKQSLRDVLPETLVMAIPEFQGMERLSEEGFLLNEFPLLKRQYDQAVEIALYYQANQLIF